MLCAVSKLCFPLSFLVVKNKVAIFGEGGGGREKKEGKGKEKRVGGGEQRNKEEVFRDL